MELAMSVQTVLNKYNKFYHVIMTTQFYRNVAWSKNKCFLTLKKYGYISKAYTSKINNEKHITVSEETLILNKKIYIIYKCKNVFHEYQVYD